MLFFLMKMDGRLRLQLFVLVLIVGVGILPDKTNGAAPRCYECGGNSPFGSCDKGSSGIRNCKAFQMCVTQYSPEPFAKITEKECGGNKELLQCLHDFWGGACTPDGGISKSEGEQLYQCAINKKANERTDLGKTIERSGSGPGRRCLCKPDLCNNEGETPEPVPTPEPTSTSDPSEVGPGEFRNFSTTVGLNNGLVFLSALVVVLFLLQDW